MKKLFIMAVIVLSLICIFTSCDMLPLPLPQEKEDEIYINDDDYLVVNGVKTEYKVDDGNDLPNESSCTHAEKVENRIEATCEKAGSYDLVTYCIKCGKEFGRICMITEVLPHTESDWIVDTVATCAEAGSHHKECTVCGTVLESEATSAIGHNYIDGSCTKCGDADPDYVPETSYSQGLEYTSNGDGTCYVSGIGTCTDTDIVIPEISPDGWTVVGIGDRVFYECVNMESISIPNIIQSIGEYAFAYCSALKYVYIYDISAWCAINFKDLTSTPLWGNENAKLYLNGILVTDLIIPEGVTHISYWAFDSCSSIESVTIPKSLVSIDAFAFSCGIIDKVYYEGNEEEWKNIRIGLNNDNLIDAPRYYYTETAPTTEGNFWHYVDGVPTVWDAYVEPEASDELAYTLSNDGTYYIVTGIGTYKESELIIPSEYKGLPVKEIAKNAFDNCDTITSATIPDSVIIINDCAFRYCRNLKDVYIGAGVKNIGYWAFGFCSNIKAVHIKDLIAWCNISFYGQASNPLEANNDTQGMGSDLYLNGELVRNLVIPEEATVIEKYAFSNCLSITSITITNATSIGDYAFWHCSNLTNIDISDSVISIGQGAFEYCYNLTCVVIPDSVTSIGTTAFGWCTNLASVVIPDNVTSIGESAFYNCKSLTDIYYTGTEEDWAKIEIDNSYGYNNYLLNATIHYSYVPEE